MLTKEEQHLLGLFGPDELHGGDVWGASRRLGIPVEKILDLSASLNPLGPPPGLADVLADSFQRLCHYPDRRAYEFREVVAAKHGLARTNVLPGNGSTGIIRLLAKALDLREIVIMAPVFGEFRRGFASAGRHFHFHNLSEANGFTITRHDVDQVMDKEPTALVLTNPATPSGALSAQEDLAYLMAKARRRNIWVIMDEAFIDFAPEEAQAWSSTLIADHPRLIVLRSMTKFYCLAGLRMGYALGDRNALAELVPLSEPWSVNTLAQEAGMFCLEQRDFAEQSRLAVDQWRDRQARALMDLGLTVFPSKVNYILCRLPGGGPTAAQVAAACAQQGVLVRDASNFIGCSPYHLRLAVTTPDKQDLALKVLAQALGN